MVFRFHRMLPEYVWDAGVLEGNPFTFPEVKTLLEGVTVGGRKLSDQEQILNLAESSKHLMDLVRKSNGRFSIWVAQQFFFDGNKRTSRFMMNGVLMTNGIDALSIPAIRAAEFNSRMVDFYTSRDATEMMAFVLDCHPEVSQIRQLNPGLSAGEAKDINQSFMC